MAILNNLIVNGSSRFLNKAYFSFIKADTVDAEEGIFKKLTATDSSLTNVSVVGLLDVTGELHTNSWTNSNIATIDGSFYITPTIGSDSGTVTTTATTLSFSGTNYAVTSLYTSVDSTVTTYTSWASGSKVLVTGEVLVDGEYLPLGSLIGELDGAATASSIKVKNVKDSHKNTASTLAMIGNVSNASYRNLKVSLYQRANGTTMYPLGIYMTALGENGRTFIDMYGGGSDTSTAVGGGMAKPVLRIGNLQGLSALTLPNGTSVSPVGWGIYTTNGFFSGTIVSTQGKIGNFTLGNAIYGAASGAGPSSISATGTAGTYLGTDGFLNTASSSVYAQITNGILTAKGVDITGKITASSGSIAGWRIESSYLASGSATAPAANVLLLSPSGTTNSYTIAGQAKTGWMITAGTTFGVNKDGGIYATFGKIGGWDITASSIQTGNYNTASTMYFGTSGLSLGTTFKVTSAGALTATGVDITGIIKANTGYIGGSSGWTIASQQISSGSIGTDNSMFLSTKNLAGTVAGQTLTTTAPSWRLTVGSNFGVDNTGKLYASGAEISGNIAATTGSISGSVTIGGTKTVTTVLNDIVEAGTKASDFISADSSGIMVYDGSDGVQQPSTVSSTTKNVFIDDNSVDIRTGTNTSASFGESVVIGSEDGYQTYIESDNMTVKNTTNVAFSVNATGEEREVTTTTSLYSRYHHVKNQASKPTNFVFPETGIRIRASDFIEGKTYKLIIEFDTPQTITWTPTHAVSYDSENIIENSYTGNCTYVRTADRIITNSCTMYTYYQPYKTDIDGNTIWRLGIRIEAPFERDPRLTQQWHATTPQLLCNKTMTINVSNVIINERTYQLEDLFGTSKETLYLGSYIATGILTNTTANLSFSFPTGRVFPEGTTIKKISFNINARASNSNGAGYYIIKNTSGGTDVATFDSSVPNKFYNANNIQKSLTSTMWATKAITGRTNIYIALHGGANYFFSGTSAINGYINNNAVTVYLSAITVELEFPAIDADSETDPEE